MAGFNFEFGHYGEGIFLLARNTSNAMNGQFANLESSHWTASQVAYGNPHVWYTMQLSVSSSPFIITTSVFDENGTSLGTFSTSDITNFTFQDINYIGLTAWGYSPSDYSFRNIHAISLGHPIAVTRAHPDFAALSVARAWLGEHRASSGRLFQRIREVRGMNYGDYAYIEAFPGRDVPVLPRAERGPPGPDLRDLDPAGGPRERAPGPAHRDPRARRADQERPHRRGLRGHPRLPHEERLPAHRHPEPGPRLPARLRVVRDGAVRRDHARAAGPAHRRRREPRRPRPPLGRATCRW